jgi:hypothetical protein
MYVSKFGCCYTTDVHVGYLPSKHQLFNDSSCEQYFILAEQ